LAEWHVVAARFLQFGFVLVLFGGSLFFLYAFKDEALLAVHQRWRWPHLCVLAAGVGGLIGIVWWVVIQAETFFPGAGLFDLKSIWIILTETSFGHITFVRMGLLAFSLLTALVFVPARNVWIIQSVYGVAILATFAWTGHGVYDSGFVGLIHTVADLFHLLAAGVWIGALLPLSVLILCSLRSQTMTDARTTLENLEQFSGIGPAVVAVLILTGLVNTWFLVGLEQWQGLITTAYGNALIIKLILFGGMLLLAGSNRYRLSPALRTDIEDFRPVASSLRALRTSILIETVLAFLVLVTVALLGILEPTISSFEPVQQRISCLTSQAGHRCRLPCIMLLLAYRNW